MYVPDRPVLDLVKTLSDSYITTLVKLLPSLINCEKTELQGSYRNYMVVLNKYR